VFERGWLSANNILFIGRTETVLVDTGYVTHAPQTVALVRQALGGRGLDRIVNTHLHSDHCGGNAALRDAFGCRIAIPVFEADKVRAWDEDALSYRATGQQCPRFGFEETVSPGDMLVLGDLPWQALAAPGHDPHALLFWCEEQGVLIAGDALWQNGFGVIFPELAGEPGFGASGLPPFTSGIEPSEIGSRQDQQVSVMGFTKWPRQESLPAAADAGPAARAAGVTTKAEIAATTAQRLERRRWPSGVMAEPPRSEGYALPARRRTAPG